MFLHFYQKIIIEKPKIIFVFLLLCVASFGFFAKEEEHEHDLLNDIEHGLKIPVEFILFFFGLMNAGVAFSAIGDATWLVLAGLFIGKPFGIFIFGWIAAKPLNFGMPEGMTYADIFVLGMVAGIGFTVSLFVATKPKLF